MKTKIIATIGPSSYNLRTIKKMKENGIKIIRINTKYADEKEFKKIYYRARSMNIKIMVDIKNLKVFSWLNKYEFDYLAVSFASTKSQIKNIKKIANSQKRNIKIISKIENKKGIKNFDSILKESHGIMVARGDLSKNVPFEKIPAIQKKMIKKCRQKRKMAITATEMLLSMTKHKTPKKSEVSDIANSVFEGSNTLMLSEETAIGKYPSLAIKTMAKIIKEAEKVKQTNEN